MDFETSSYASSFMQSVDTPKELLLVLNILNEKQQQQQKLSSHKCRQQEEEEQQQPSQQHMELSQIELIYRAEGNANLVLALPQFKKVLRLPKIQQKQQHEPQYQETEYNQKYSQQHQHTQELHKQQKQQHVTKQHKPNQILSTGQQQTKNASVGILTMDHYVAYISIIRCLVGNEFIFEPDIIAVPNSNDRDWINEHIKPYRPANRLDKEFGGQFGLLLPDATMLPAELDISFFNLQSTTKKTLQCCSTNNIFGGDTYAVEIKPKQGWLLSNDVNNLFDIKPTGTSEAASTTESNVFNTSTDNKCFTTTPNRSSSKQRPTTATTTTTTIPSSMSTTRDDKISHFVPHRKVDIRCRYCSMQFLKLNQQKINKRNHYCPIDLFSGVTERMFCALRELFESPQNNLRVFKNGNLVFDDHLSRTSKIEDLFSSDKLQLIKQLLVACLLREYCKEEQAEKETVSASEDDDEKQADDKETQGNKDGGDGQPQSSVTPCKKQKINTMPTTTTTTTVTETDVTKAKTTLTSTIPSVMDTRKCSSSPHSVVSLEHINSNSNNYNDKTEVLCLPKNCVLQKVLHLQLLAKINFQYMLDHEYAFKKEKTHYVLYGLLKKFIENHNQLDFFQLLPEEQYLLAATALDCSIMITFNEIGNIAISLPNSRHVVTISGRRFLTKVTLLDLDPKPDTHFAKYCHQTKEIDDVLEKLRHFN